MSASTPLLTIGLPTFNNPRGARIQIESLIDQILSLNAMKRIDILISDNSENLETLNCISEVDARGVLLEYRRNASNIGYDRNVDRVLTEARGTYCWLLSDNDPVASGALRAIVSALEKYGQAAHLIIDTTLGVENVVQYANYEDLARSFGDSLPGGLVSQNIFKRSLLPADRFRFYGNHWFHLALLLQICAKKPVVLLPNLFLPEEDNQCNWAKDGMTFITFTSLLSIVKTLKQYGYSEEFCATQEAAFNKSFPQQLVTGKLYGLRPRIENFRIIDASFGREPLNRLYCYVLLLTPTLIFRLLKNVKNLWKRSLQ